MYKISTIITTTKISALLFATFISASAFATGGTYCKVDDKNFNIDVSLTNARVPGSALLAPSSIKIQYKQPTLAIGFKEYTFKKTSPTESQIPYWFQFKNELKFGALAFPETDGEGNPIDASVEIYIVVDTKCSTRTSECKGDYTVVQNVNAPNIPNTLKSELKGKISCSVE